MLVRLWYACAQYQVGLQSMNMFKSARTPIGVGDPVFSGISAGNPAGTGPAKSDPATNPDVGVDGDPRTPNRG